MRHMIEVDIQGTGRSGAGCGSVGGSWRALWGGGMKGTGCGANRAKEVRRCGAGRMSKQGKGNGGQGAKAEWAGRGARGCEAGCRS